MQFHGFDACRKPLVRSLSYLFLMCLSAVVYSGEYLVPFDERRIDISKVGTLNRYDDEHKICKDRWFKLDTIPYCGPKGHLENFDLSELRYVGYLKNQAGEWPLLAEPEGLINRLSIGTRIGKRNGVVKAFTEDFIVILEIASEVKEGERNFFKRCNYILKDGADESKYELPEFP